MNKYIMILLTFLLLNLISCNITEPPDKNNKQEPTSHDFTWQKFYFGELGTSEINDIVVINENNIWAVGTIWYPDSLNPNDVQFFNGVHWDGYNWKLLKIPFKVSRYNNELLPDPLKSIFALNSDNIWFTNGFQIVNMIGNQYGDWKFLSGEINKLGGSNETVWAAGKNSNLFKKNINDGNWQKINVDKPGDILDVFGIVNSNNGKKIYMPLINWDDIKENYIMEVDNNSKITFFKSAQRLIASVWTKSGFPVYLAGDGIFENIEGYWKEINYGAKKFIERIRGNDLNDILAAGAWGTVAHYNGEDWKTYPELEMDGNYKALSYKDNIAAIAGIEGARAVVVIGIRKK
ncbi:MAG TPA: hypothetical protein VLB84_08285 [Bacteroidia bacterium]|nr:hypothetical protein [Bacteroidia bacterium]